MSTVRVQGQDLYYRSHTARVPAKGPPLVLVHGAGGNHMHWPGELRRLPGRTVYALDWPGHGKSGGSGCTDITGYTEILRGFVEALKLPLFVLGGHSMGGAVAIEFALRYPGRLAGLVLIGTGARLRVAPQILTGILDDPDATAGLLAEWTHAEGTSANLLRLYRRQLADVSPQVVYGDFVACDGFDRREDVAQADLPTLMLCGGADRMTPVKYSEFLRDHMRGSELVVVPDAGHMVMLERPLQVAAAVEQFLRRLDL